MRSYVCFVLIFFGSCKLTAQTKVLDYYKKTNLAELAICDSNFTAANNYYKEAFVVNPNKPFGKDLGNAFYSAMDSHDYTLAEKYMSTLLHRGLDSEFIMHALSTYNGEPLKLLKGMLARHPNNLLKIKNDPLVKKLKEMTKWDRDVRMYFTELYNGDYMVDSTYKVDDINARALLKILKEKGIPAGATTREADYEVIIWHNTGASSGGYRGHIFDTLLYKAVLTFDYDARKFAHTVSESPLGAFKYKDLTLHFPLTIMGATFNGKMYLECYDDTSEARINTERFKLGLESLGDFRRKLAGVNSGLDPNSILHKYELVSVVSLLDIDDETTMRIWLKTKGENAPVKRPYDFTGASKLLKIGSVGNIYVVGKTRYADLIRTFRNWNSDYNQGEIYFAHWKNAKPPVRSNCHAQIIENPKDDLTTDTGRDNRAKFVPGYTFFIQDGWGYFDAGNSSFKTIETLFDTDSTLIHSTANVLTNYYKTVTYYCGLPTSVSMKYKMVPAPNDARHNIRLNIKTYTWQKGNNKTEVVAEDQLNAKGRKITTTSYSMTDIPKYALYQQKVAAEKSRLDKEYGKGKQVMEK